MENAEANMSRFVVLYHQMPDSATRPSHWDLMIQDGGVLATWQLLEWPPAGTILVKRLDDHRLTYLDFEGEVDKDRGRVTRIEFGDMEPLEQNDEVQHVNLVGQAFAATLYLEHDRGQFWRLSVGD